MEGDDVARLCVKGQDIGSGALCTLSSFLVASCRLDLQRGQTFVWPVGGVVNQTADFGPSFYSIIIRAEKGLLAPFNKLQRLWKRAVLAQRARRRFNGIHKVTASGPAMGRSEVSVCQVTGAAFPSLMKSCSPT